MKLRFGHKKKKTQSAFFEIQASDPIRLNFFAVRVINTIFFVDILVKKESENFIANKKRTLW
jgi:hypothetical protein